MLAWGLTFSPAYGDWSTTLVDNCWEVLEKSYADKTSVGICLIKIMPGAYDLGAEHIALSSYVSVEGSGAGVTIVTSSSDVSTMGEGLATVTNVSLAGMTIENTSATSARSIMVGQSSSWLITDVAIVATGGTRAFDGNFDAVVCP